jgi:hypothetical protein
MVKTAGEAVESQEAGGRGMPDIKPRADDDAMTGRGISPRKAP